MYQTFELQYHISYKYHSEMEKQLILKCFAIFNSARFWKSYEVFALEVCNILTVLPPSKFRLLHYYYFSLKIIKL